MDFGLNFAAGMVQSLQQRDMGLINGSMPGIMQLASSMNPMVRDLENQAQMAAMRQSGFNTSVNPNLYHQLPVATHQPYTTPYRPVLPSPQGTFTPTQPLILFAPVVNQAQTDRPSTTESRTVQPETTHQAYKSKMAQINNRLQTVLAEKDQAIQNKKDTFKAKIEKLKIDFETQVSDIQRAIENHKKECKEKLAQLNEALKIQRGEPQNTAESRSKIRAIEREKRLAEQKRDSDIRRLESQKRQLEQRFEQEKYQAEHTYDNDIRALEREKRDAQYQQDRDKHAADREHHHYDSERARQMRSIKRQRHLARLRCSRD